MSGFFDNALLYARTVSHLRPSQVLVRAWRRLGGRTPLRMVYTPSPDVAKADLSRVPALPELDFDPAFLSRFDVDALLADNLELLHHEEAINWRTCWYESLDTPLWRFNLHYHEYLLPLAKAHLDTGDPRYLAKAKAIITSWISACPEANGGDAWHPYVISMRAVNWLAFRGELSEALTVDASFCSRIDESLAQQYRSLSQHLETDLLANHYLENLKALTILACYFADWRTLTLVLPKLKAQVEEQILPDGMHFELSPMYHKIVFEDLMRVVATLHESGLKGDLVDEYRLQDMADVLWSFEGGCNRTPLFNDSGDNVAKSRDALLDCAGARFGVVPKGRALLPDAGYAILERYTTAGYVKAIFDVGNPGPLYAMGHVHCDALSMECFVDGKPIIVNSGTYAYQGKSRSWFRSNESSSGVTVDDTEQNECWDLFRIARYGLGYIVSDNANGLTACFRDYLGNEAIRHIEVDKSRITVSTSASLSKKVICRYHLASGVTLRRVTDGEFTFSTEAACGTLTLRGVDSLRIILTTRATEFGLKEEGLTIVASSWSEQQMILSLYEEVR